jgi:ferredoxin
MIRVEVNRTTCNGYGNCVLAADSIFDLDDDGRVVLKQPAVDEAQLEAVRRAAYDCPTDSITYAEGDTDATGAARA